MLGGACRFEPSCSEYAVEAVKLHPPTSAIRLIAIRVCACRPGGRHGFDPVPPPAVKPQEKTA
ncbi:MAG: membrane protein insertion efficiency factor YidD [Bdellovibrionota bacterium]